jgi:hypothetical protein
MRARLGSGFRSQRSRLSGQTAGTGLTRTIASTAELARRLAAAGSHHMSRSSSCSSCPSSTTTAPPHVRSHLGMGRQLPGDGAQYRRRSSPHRGNGPRPGRRRLRLIRKRATVQPRSEVPPPTRADSFVPGRQRPRTSRDRRLPACLRRGSLHTGCQPCRRADAGAPTAVPRRAARCRMPRTAALTASRSVEDD